MTPRRSPLAVLSLAWLAASCGGGGGGFQMPPVRVEVSAVQNEVVRDRFRALGTVEASEIVKVVSEVNAVARALPFAEGQPVRRAELLAQLDDAEIAAEALRAEALRDQARSSLDRVQQLHEQGAASPQERDDASAAFKVAEANLRLAEARLSKTRILSPLDGVIGRRLVSPGAFLRVGDPITEVAALDPVKVTFAAPERFAAHLRAGGTVQVTTTAYPGRRFAGHVQVVDPILDPGTRTVQLIATVPNRGRLLRPGMSADVSATLAERPAALTVPDEAVFAQGEQMFVYVVKPDSTVARQAVAIGSRDSARVEITHGLGAGDLVVRAGHQKLFDGARVQPVPEGGVAAAPGAPPAPAAQAPRARRGSAQAAPAGGAR
jgi:membrane fusion protein (multidrug efflux system)